MKAITISQPYASLIAFGEKWIENRTWHTKYRGELAIHAGLGTQYLTKKGLADYPTGCVIAIANLVACVHIDHIERESGLEAVMHQKIPGTSHTWYDAGNHPHTEGTFCWILENVRKIEPVPAVGKQGFWKWCNGVNSNNV